MLSDPRDRVVLSVLVAATLSATTTVLLVNPYPFPMVVKDIKLFTTTGNAAHDATDNYTLQVTSVTANKTMYVSAPNTNSFVRTIAASVPTSMGAPTQNATIPANDTLSIVATKANAGGNLANVYVSLELVPG